MTSALLESVRLEDVRAERDRRRWIGSTRAYAWDNFKFEPDHWQGEVFDAFDDPTVPRIAMSACAGPGKTAVEAICTWKFLDCHWDRDNHPKGAAVSVTEDNLRDNLWPELSKWQSRSERLQREFRWTKERVFRIAHPETWFMSARSFAKTASADEMGKTLSGLHGKYILAVGDEVGAIPPAVGRAAEQALSTGPTFGKILVGGNPISLEGWLHEAAVRLAHLWRVIRITGDPDDPLAWVHSPRVATVAPGQQTPAEWARQQIQAYGRDNPWVMSYILGKFPPSSLNSLLGPEDVQAAMTRALEPDVYTWAQMRLGVDVARYGDDRTVIFPRQGRKALMPSVMRHSRDSAVSTDIATKVLALRSELNAKLTIMDATGGWAAGASDVLQATGERPVNVQFHAPAAGDKYKNRRAEMWFAMAEWVKSGGQLPNVPELTAELTTPTYTFVNGRFLIEPKEQVKERLGRSPDLADALALTFAVPEGARPITKPDRQRAVYGGPSGWMS